MKYLFLLILTVWAQGSFAMDAYEKTMEQESKQLVSSVGILSGWSWGISKKEADDILSNLSKEKYFPYQDIMVNGERLWKGLGTDCPSRYAAIHRAIVKKYNRPVTVLDIGANNGYFSLNLANRLGSQCVMVDLSDRLGTICELNTNVADKLIYLKKALSAGDLEAIGKSVHFDVVILLHVLHHVPEWKDFFDKASGIADTVVVETPPSNDPRLEKKTTIPAIEKELQSRNGIIIAQTPRVKPGCFDSLKKMEYGAMHNVPVDVAVKSSMYVFNNVQSNRSFNPIKPETLAKFGLAYPKQSLNKICRLCRGL